MKSESNRPVLEQETEVDRCVQQVGHERGARSARTSPSRHRPFDKARYRLGRPCQKRSLNS